MQPFNLTNYAEHPSDPNWLVFRFATAEQAKEFEQALRSEGLRHERDAVGDPPHMVAARRADREKAVRLNYVVLGRHREPFIANKGLRWGLIVLLGLMLALIAIGAILGDSA